MGYSLTLVIPAQAELIKKKRHRQIVVASVKVFFMTFLLFGNRMNGSKAVGYKIDRGRDSLPQQF